MRYLAVLAGLICWSALSAQATPLPVNFVFAELPPNSTQVPLPFLLDGVIDTMFLKFKVPDISSASAINSFTIDVLVYDDGDGGGETGTIQFALAGQNITLASFFPNLNRITAANPLDISISLDPSQIAIIFPQIQDGNFRIKVLRDTGDFVVGAASASIDATLVPEPNSFFSGVSGLLLAAGWLSRRASRARRGL